MAEHAGLYCVDGVACRREECTEQLQMCRHDREYAQLICRDKSADIAEIADLRRQLAEKAAESVKVPSGWLSVDEQTPPDGVKVLTYPGWIDEVDIDEWCAQYNTFLMHIEDGTRPSHWMPLPAAPTKETDHE